MTALAFLVVVLSQVCLVGGQIFMKHAMMESNKPRPDRKRFAINLALGIVVSSFWFFLWLGLLQKFDLSFIYPFEGLSPLMLAVGASLFLHEKITRRLAFGILLMCVGLALISASK